MQLDLSEPEREVLEDVLTRALSNLREEIYKTDLADYKDALREREALMRRVLSRFGPQPTRSP